MNVLKANIKRGNGHSQKTPHLKAESINVVSGGLEKLSPSGAAWESSQDPHAIGQDDIQQADGTWAGCRKNGLMEGQCFHKVWN